MEPDWNAVEWVVRVNGTVDAFLSWLTLDGWSLGHGNPAHESLYVFPRDDGSKPTMADAQWIADVMAFDHDAPIDAAPRGSGHFGNLPPSGTVTQPIVPAGPLSLEHSVRYWENLRIAHQAAADNRFDAPFTLRYEDGPDAPGTDFSQRFSNERTRNLVSLYAMASRQADVLSEYLCLYRILEAVDGGNGKAAATHLLPDLTTYQFGHLSLVEVFVDPPARVNAFDRYRAWAVDEIGELGLDDPDVDLAGYLYKIRNSLAHGKHEALTTGRGEEFMAAARALPIVKLLARMAVEQTT